MKKGITREKKKERFKTVDTSKFKKTEFIISLLIGIIFLVMVCFAVCNKIFVPVTLILFSLFLFSICYYYIEDNSKKKLVYLLFSLGVVFILIEVVYTLVNIL